MGKFLFIWLLLALPLVSMSQELDRLILNNEYDKALQLIDSSLARNRNQPTLYLKKGTVLQRKFDYQGALFSLQRALALDSLNKAIISELADVNTSLGNFRQALPYYKRLYDSDTTNRVNALRVSRAYFNLKSYQEPYRILRSAYYRDSSNLYLNKLLALSAMRTGRDNLAITLFSGVKQQNPSDFSNYSNLIQLYQKKENYLQLTETLEEAIQFFPEETNLLIRLGDAHYSKRAYPKATGPYEKYLASGDSVPDVLKNLGICYYYEKKHREGIYLLEKSLMLRPNDPVAGLFLGLCYKELDELEESIGYLNFAAKIAVPYYMSDILNQLGNIYLEKKEYRKSVDLLKKAYRVDTTKYEILFKIGNTYDVWQKDKNPAMRYYKFYLESPKDSSEMHRKLTEYVLERKKKLGR
jgi:tetratricopeptide (TPR) repeat protein